MVNSHQTVTISVHVMTFNETVEFIFTNYYISLSNKHISNITAHVIITRKSKKSLCAYLLVFKL